MLLIADEIEKFLERCPAELYDRIKDSFVRSEWDAFVAGELKESRQRDSQPLGGGRPAIAMQPVAAKQEYESNEDDEGGSSALSGQPLTRSASTGDSFGFGSTEEDFKFRGVSRVHAFDSASAFQLAHVRRTFSSIVSLRTRPTPGLLPRRTKTAMIALQNPLGQIVAGVSKCSPMVST
jgi:hypothetical protein